MAKKEKGISERQLKFIARVLKMCNDFVAEEDGDFLESIEACLMVSGMMIGSSVYLLEPYSRVSTDDLLETILVRIKELAINKISELQQMDAEEVEYED